MVDELTKEGDDGGPKPAKGDEGKPPPQTNAPGPADHWRITERIEKEVLEAFEQRDAVAEAARKARTKTRKRILGAIAASLVAIQLGGLIFNHNRVILDGLNWLHGRFFPESDVVAVSYEKYFELEPAGPDSRGVEGLQIRFYATKGQVVKLWWTIFPPNLAQHVLVMVDGTKPKWKLEPEATTLWPITEYLKFVDSEPGSTPRSVGKAETNIHQLTFVLKGNPSSPISVHPVVVVYGKAR